MSKRRISKLGGIDEEKEDVNQEIYQRKFEARENEQVHVHIFKKRPLGLDVESGQDGRNLYVTEAKGTIVAGALVVQINDKVVRDKDAPDIVEIIQGFKLPIQMCFVSDRTANRGRGLSLKLRMSMLMVGPGLVRMYLPNGQAYAFEMDGLTLAQAVNKACEANALKSEMLVLLMQNKEKENDIQHPKMDDDCGKTVKENPSYRFRLIPKSKAELVRKGIPSDGLSILSKNDFDENEIDEVQTLLKELRKLAIDATITALTKAIREDIGNDDISADEIRGVAEWHKNQMRTSILAAPVANFMRVWFDKGPLKNKTYAIKDSKITAGELCAILAKDRKVEEKEEEDYALHICGNADLRKFEQELNPDDIPSKVKDAIMASGVYGQLKFMYKKIAESESEDSSGMSDSEIDDAPTAKAFRLGSIDGWSPDQIEKLRTQMAEQLMEYKKQATEAEVDLKAQEEEDAMQKELEEKRLELVKECVINQYQLAEVIHDFDAGAIENFPEYKALQDLRVGEVIIVTENDPSGWSKGKNINGGIEAFFPTSYVDVVAQPEMLVEAIHDFDPDSVQNLPAALVIVELQRGDQILVTGTHVSGWWRGCKVKGGPEGYFPGDYTKILAQPAVDPVDTFKIVYGPAVLEGHVSLRVGVLKRWLMKYCYLTGTELLYFNNLQSDPREPAGRIPIIQANVKSSVKKSKKKTRFDITVGKKKYELKTDEDDVDEWIKEIDALIKENQMSL